MTEILLRAALLGAEWVMYLLLALSVWSLGVMIERLIFFTRYRADLNRLRGLLADPTQGWAELRRSLEQDRSVEAAIARVALGQAERGPEAVGEMLKVAQAQQRQRTERGLLLLGTLGNNAPFVGLFGTVLGIIQAFHDLSSNPQGGATTVMAGISEALVATAVGLIVALPAVVGFNYFSKRANDVAANAEMLVGIAIARLRGQTAPRAAAE